MLRAATGATQVGRKDMIFGQSLAFEIIISPSKIAQCQRVFGFAHWSLSQDIYLTRPDNLHYRAGTSSQTATNCSTETVAGIFGEKNRGFGMSLLQIWYIS
ncbi:hypothetical protein BD779DRAFT_634593 [Infundibulicybe gibba]|nr:hypothetical protein BD779DRAFT_634593 [Infundibulicybe gibba]